MNDHALESIEKKSEYAWKVECICGWTDESDTDLNALKLQKKHQDEMVKTPLI